MGFIRSYNFELRQEHMELNNGELITDPSMSLTVREIVYRIAQGLPVSSDMELRYPNQDEDFDDIPDPERPGFDLADVSVLQEQLELRKRAKKAQKELIDEKTNPNKEDTEVRVPDPSQESGISDLPKQE